jgi:hypothetical protein
LALLDLFKRERAFFYLKMFEAPPAAFVITGGAFCFRGRRFGLRESLPARLAASTAARASAVATSTATTATTVAATATAAAATIAAVAATTTATAAASTAIFARARFVDGQGATIDFLTIKLLNGRLAFFCRGHFDEAEAARASRLTVFNDRS